MNLNEVLTDEEITKWIKINNYFYLHQIEEWKKYNFSLEDYQQWKNLGFGEYDAQYAANWRDHFTLEETKYWIQELDLDKKKDFKKVYYWKYTDQVPKNKEELERLQQAGFSTQQWVDFFYPQDSVCWVNDESSDRGKRRDHFLFIFNEP